VRPDVDFSKIAPCFTSVLRRLSMSSSFEIDGRREEEETARSSPDFLSVEDERPMDRDPAEDGMPGDVAA